MDAEWDDDAPPPLNNIGDQLHAAQLANSIIGTAGLKAGDLRVAAVTDSSGAAHARCSQPQHSKAPAKQPFKRGFLDAKPRAAAKPCSSKQGSNKVGSTDGTLPVLKAYQQQHSGKVVPDFMKVPLSEQEQQLATLKSQLISALQPNPDTVQEVSKDATLMSGFDDPEVMAAVSEVANDPKAYTKHANNPKVVQFYKAMGGLLGSKLEQMGSSMGGSMQQAATKQAACSRPYLP